MGFQHLGIWRTSESEDPQFSSEHHPCDEVGVGKWCNSGDLLILVQLASATCLIQAHQTSPALFTKVASVAFGIANSLEPTKTPWECSVKIPATPTASRLGLFAWQLFWMGMRMGQNDRKLQITSFVVI